MWGSFLSLLLFLAFSVNALDHKYNAQDPVPFYVNKIGPYSNPSETYDYYSLPFCKPEGRVQHRHISFGEALEGALLLHSLYDIRFNVDIQWQSLCKVHLSKEEIDRFKKAIDDFYFFEMYFDELPLRGFIGTVDRTAGPDGAVRYYLFKHLHFEVLYNAGSGHVIYANVSSDLRQVQELGEEDNLMVEFSYSARWTPTSVQFGQRGELFKDNFFEQEMEIHWLSIMNSCVLVMLLTGFIAIIILRVLKSDYIRYAPKDDETTDDDQEDYGWKLIHGDVFRIPPYLSLFCALIGIGAQFLTMSFLILTIAMLRQFYPGPGGTLYSDAIIVYAFNCVVAGFVSARLFKQLNGERWVWNLILVSTLYSVPFFLISNVVNFIAYSYDTTSTIPFRFVVLVLLLWAVVGFPLTVIGGIAGKRFAGKFEAPTQTKNFPRLIPSAPWYRQAPIQMLMAGFLPFSAIYIELYYIFTSLWGHTSYTLFGILFLVFIILLVVTACITIALTYFQLSMEDHKWWWRSFLSGGSTGLFIYAYSFFYYVYRSKMTGLLQASFYFGYMFVLCYYFFLMLGTVGFYSSLFFIRHIYRNLKIE